MFGGGRREEGDKGEEGRPGEEGKEEGGREERERREGGEEGGRREKERERERGREKHLTGLIVINNKWPQILRQINK
jgi:hypothetical protein